MQELIQVTFASSRVEIQERETKALVKAAKSLRQSKGTVITWDFEDSTTIDGIEVAFTPVWKWLASN